ncbi:MAG: ferritin [Aureispira sp.]
MLSQKTLDALNQQIALEEYSSAAYLSMASWCDREGLDGCAKFFYAQSEEERMHMLKIVHYVNEMDGHALISAVEQPPREFDSIQDLFQAVYQQEQKVTRSIYELVTITEGEKDHSTNLFLQWYVAEQREEEAQVRSILDKIKIIGTGGQSLYFIDQEIEKINQQRDQEAEAASESGA